MKTIRCKQVKGDTLDLTGPLEQDPSRRRRSRTSFLSVHSSASQASVCIVLTKRSVTKLRDELTRILREGW